MVGKICCFPHSELLDKYVLMVYWEKCSVCWLDWIHLQFSVMFSMSFAGFHELDQ